MDAAGAGIEAVAHLSVHISDKQCSDSVDVNTEKPKMEITGGQETNSDGEGKNSNGAGKVDKTKK